jgi:hypothetical protein
MSMQPPAGALPPIAPNCPNPKCGKPMPFLGLYAWQIETLIIPAIMCPHCHVLLHAQFDKPQRAPEPDTGDTAPDQKVWTPQ